MPNNSCLVNWGPLISLKLHSFKPLLTLPVSIPGSQRQFSTAGLSKYAHHAECVILNWKPQRKMEPAGRSWWLCMAFSVCWDWTSVFIHSSNDSTGEFKGHHWLHNVFLHSTFAFIVRIVKDTHHFYIQTYFQVND